MELVIASTKGQVGTSRCAGWQGQNVTYKSRILRREKLWIGMARRLKFRKLSNVSGQKKQRKGRKNAANGRGATYTGLTGPGGKTVGVWSQKENYNRREYKS